MRVTHSNSKKRSALRGASVTAGLICLALVAGCNDESTSSSDDAGTGAATSPADTASSTPVGSGNATVSWMPPQENTDGSYASDLAGYKIYYGNSASNLNNVVQINTPGITAYVLTDLAQGAWYFAVSAYNAQGIEGPISEVANKIIS